jgi:glucokinase
MSAFAIGIDVGGTKIAAALIDRDGRTIAQRRCPTCAKNGVEAVVEQIVAYINELAGESPGPVAGAGVGVAAIVDVRRGLAISGVNLGWADVPVMRMLTERLGDMWQGRLWVERDTNAAALGEYVYGAGRGATDLLYVTVGTGIGAALILDGRLARGAEGGSGNIGHFVLDPQGERCACGKRGCTETMASGPAIAHRAAAALRSGKTSALRDLALDAITTVEVVEAAKDGDALAIQTLAEAGRYLGIAIAYCVDLINPDRVVIGGGVMAAGDLLLDPVRRIVAEYALPSNARLARIVPADLGSEAGAIGAAALVWHDD